MKRHRTRAEVQRNYDNSKALGESFQDVIDQEVEEFVKVEMLNESEHFRKKFIGEARQLARLRLRAYEESAAKTRTRLGFRPFSWAHETVDRVRDVMYGEHRDLKVRRATTFEGDDSQFCLRAQLAEFGGLLGGKAKGVSSGEQVAKSIRRKPEFEGRNDPLFVPRGLRFVAAVDGKSRSDFPLEKRARFLGEKWDAEEKEIARRSEKPRRKREGLEAVFADVARKYRGEFDD